MAKHAGGRPLKFKTVQELEDVADSDIEFELNGNNLSTNEFDKESDLSDYIIENIEKFVFDFLDDELISFEVDSPIQKHRRFSPRGRRIDLFIKGKKKVYIIELKNPSSGTESRGAIGQILDYGREFLDTEKELLILTTKFDLNTAKTIKFYNLPIRYIYIDKKRIMEYKDITYD